MHPDRKLFVIYETKGNPNGRYDFNCLGIEGLFLGGAIDNFAVATSRRPNVELRPPLSLQHLSIYILNVDDVPDRGSLIELATGLPWRARVCR